MTDQHHTHRNGSHAISEETKINVRAWGAMVQNILAIGASLFLGVLVLSQFDNTVPIRFLSNDTHVFSEPDGRAFWVTRETCLDRDIPALGLPRLVSLDRTIAIPLPSKPLSTTLGCKKITVLVLIPEEVPAGEYEYLITFRFQMNPFKTLDVQANAVRVTVRK